MPTITLNKKTVMDFLGKSYDDEVLADRIAMLGTDLEEITKNEIKVEIFPNRPDLLSEQGFARALKSFLEIETGLREYKVNKSNYKLIIDTSVKEVRPYTACAIIKNLKFDDEKIKEIIQIQEKLHITFGRKRKRAAIGIYPLEHISMPITFKADKPENIVFKPLESTREMNALQILSQHPTGREYGHLLEGKEVFPYFIDAENNILSVPPIINSDKTGRITENTTEVFIECSGFDKNVLNQCLNMIVCALADMGGEIYEITVKNKHEKKTYVLPNLTPESMKIDIEYVNKRLGLELSEKEVQKYLEQMGFGYDNGNVFVPPYRTDILAQIDLIEDIAIAYGFENFEAIIPNVATTGKEAPIEKFKQKIREILIGLNLFEVYNYNITSSEIQTEKMGVDYPVIKLANSLTIEFDAIRYWVLPSLLETLRLNKRYEYPQKYFEFGRVFKKTDKGETGITEQEHLSVLLCNKRLEFTQIKQVLNTIFFALEKEYLLVRIEHRTFIPGRVGVIQYNGEDLGVIGEIHPKIISDFDINYPLAGFELNITALFDKIKDHL